MSFLLIQNSLAELQVDPHPTEFYHLVGSSIYLSLIIVVLSTSIKLRWCSIYNKYSNNYINIWNWHLIEDIRKDTSPNVRGTFERAHKMCDIMCTTISRATHSKANRINFIIENRNCKNICLLWNIRIKSKLILLVTARKLEVQ